MCTCVFPKVYEPAQAVDGVCCAEYCPDALHGHVGARVQPQALQLPQGVLTDDGSPGRVRQGLKVTIKVHLKS